MCWLPLFDFRLRQGVLHKDLENQLDIRIVFKQVLDVFDFSEYIRDTLLNCKIRSNGPSADGLDEVKD